ncbi:MAG: hypothetical protein QNJ38_08960 [Prochloraceae cyanobacterium]|nr:hypothetical protein [Prochloraceae cyanobacterium]
MSYKAVKILALTVISAFFVLITNVAFARENIEIEIAPQQVDVSAIIENGNNLIIEENQVVKKDAVAIGASLIVLEGAKIRGNATAIGGNIILQNNAIVDGDTVAFGGKVIKGEGVSIGGDIVEILGGASKIVADNTAALQKRFGVFGSFYLINLAICLFLLVIIFAVGLFLIILLPTHLQKTSMTIAQQPFKSGVLGLAAILTVYLLTQLLAGSLFGLVMIPMMDIVFAIAGLLGCTATSLSIGKKIKASGGSIQHFFIGILMFVPIALIPVAGAFIILMVNIFGFGAVLLSKFGTIDMDIIDNTYEAANISQYPIVKN